MSEKKLSEELFYGLRAREYVKGLGVDLDSPDGHMIQSLLRGMSAAAHRIDSAAYWIRSSMNGVDMRFTKAAETGDLASVHLNSLGELQAQAVAYDAGVAAYAALNDQLEFLVAEIRHRQEGEQR